MIQITLSGDRLVQWDKNRRIVIAGVDDSSNVEVHFASAADRRAYVLLPYTEDDTLYADIPNILLCQQRNIRVYLYRAGDTAHTFLDTELPITARPKPDDYIYTPTEVLDYYALNTRIDGKQDVIPDLTAIRSGAALGATALQSHQDISGKQDIIPDLAAIRSGASAGATALQKYGVKWSVTDSNDEGSRCFGAVGLHAEIGIGSADGSSDFDYVYPWSEIKRCNIRQTVSGANIITYEGEAGFALDGTNGDVFVRIPKFRISRYVKDGYEYRVIGDGNTHEAFIENGTELDEIFIGAFEGYADGGKLRSVGGVTPTSNTTPETFLNYAKANGENYSLYDMRCVDAVWSLMAVEYGKRNTNRIIGYGLADFEQPVTGGRHQIAEAAVNTNSVKVSTWTALQKEYMPVGSNITVCRGDQYTIVATRKITNVADSGEFTVFTFDGTPIDVTTSDFIGTCAFNANWCEDCPSRQLSWHTGRADWINNRTQAEITRNPVRYRWIENVVGNLWHYLPDVTFSGLQMYVCKNMADYEFHKTTGAYKPVGGTLTAQGSNGNKKDIVDVNYWVSGLLNDTFAKYVSFGKAYDMSLTSDKAFGAYYYLGSGTDCIANGGGFDHLWRCNMLTHRAMIPPESKWYLYGARLIFKNLPPQMDTYDGGVE